MLFREIVAGREKKYTTSCSILAAVYVINPFSRFNSQEVYKTQLSFGTISLLINKKGTGFCFSRKVKKNTIIYFFIEIL